MFNLSQRDEAESPRDLIRRVKLPILILDPLWIELFPKEHKSGRIIELEKRLVELLKDEASGVERQKILKEKKKRNMQKINELTLDVYVNNSEKAKTEMEKSRADILEINEKLIKSDEKLIEIEDKIGETNLDLLEETVRICFELMVKSKEAAEKLTPRVESLRKELFSAISERMGNEEMYDTTYNLLYKLVGREIISALEREAGEKRG